MAAELTIFYITLVFIKIIDQEGRFNTARSECIIFKSLRNCIHISNIFKNIFILQNVIVIQLWFIHLYMICIHIVTNLNIPFTKTRSLLPELRARYCSVLVISLPFHVWKSFSSQSSSSAMRFSVVQPPLPVSQFPQYAAGPLICSQSWCVFFPGHYNNIYSRFPVEFSDSFPEAKSKWPRRSQSSLTSEPRTSRLASSMVWLLRVTSCSQLSFSAVAFSKWSLASRSKRSK